MAFTHRNALVLTENGITSGLVLSSANTTNPNTTGAIRYVSGTGFVMKTGNQRLFLGDIGVGLYAGNTTAPASAGQIGYVSGAGFVGYTQGGAINFATQSTTVTAQNDGATPATTATIPTTAGFVNVTAASAAAGVVYLPAPISGKVIIISCESTGFELRSNNSTTVAINGGTAAAAESAIAAGAVIWAVCVPYASQGATTHNWKALNITSGSGIGIVETAAT